MTLTVREKEHWKERIEAKISKRIENLKAEDPERFEKINKKARLLAVESLGIAKLHARTEAISEERDALSIEADRLACEMYALLHPSRAAAYAYRPQCEIESTVNKAAKRHEEQLLAKDKLGSQICQLLHEKENLLDTVWLATSNRQMKELWLSVSSLLGEAATALQSEAISINSHGKD